MLLLFSAVQSFYLKQLAQYSRTTFIAVAADFISYRLFAADTCMPTSATALFKRMIIFSHIGMMRIRVNLCLCRFLVVGCDQMFTAFGIVVVCKSGKRENGTLGYAGQLMFSIAAVELRLLVSPPSIERHPACMNDSRR
jgi:hypothetical protein